MVQTIATLIDETLMVMGAHLHVRMTDEEKAYLDAHGSPDKPGGLSIQLCKSEKKEFYIRYSS